MSQNQLTKANTELNEKADLLAVEAECHEEDAIRMTEMIAQLKQKMRTKIDDLATCVNDVG